MSVASAAFASTNTLSLTQAATAVLESRSDYRVGADFPVEIHSPALHAPLVAQARDISAGGVCIATPTPFELEGLQSLTLQLPSGPLRLEAIGRWQRNVTSDEAVLTGIEFASFSPAQVSTIWDVVHDTSRQLGSFVYKAFSEHEPTIDDAMSIAQISRLRSVGRRKYIYQRGCGTSEDDSIFIVKQGGVDLLLPQGAGRDFTIAELGPGQLFGGLAAVASIPNLETALTTDDTVLLEISRASFSYIRLARPLLAHWLGGLVMRSYLGRVEKLVDRAVDLLRP